MGYPCDAEGRHLAGRSRQRALQQAGASEALAACREGLGGAAPPQFVDIVEEARAGPERRQILEEEGRAAPVIAEDGGGEVLDDAVAVQQTRRGFWTDPRDARISIRRIADEREEVGNEDGVHSKLLANACRIEDPPASPVNLPDATPRWVAPSSIVSSTVCSTPVTAPNGGSSPLVTRRRP